jgi:hypothetical protein
VNEEHHITMDHQSLPLNDPSPANETNTATRDLAHTPMMNPMEHCDSSETESETSLDTTNWIAFASEDDNTSINPPMNMGSEELRSREGRFCFSSAFATVPRVVASRVTTKMSTEELECLQRLTGNGLVDISTRIPTPGEEWVPIRDTTTQGTGRDSRHSQICLARLGHVQTGTSVLSIIPTTSEATFMSTITTPALSDVDTETLANNECASLHRVHANTPARTPKPSFLHKCKLGLRNGFSKVRYTFPGHCTKEREPWERRREIPMVTIANEDERTKLSTDTYDWCEEGRRRRRLEEREESEDMEREGLEREEREEMERKEKERVDALLANPETSSVQPYKVPNEFDDIVSRLYPLPRPVVHRPLYRVDQPVQEVPREIMTIPQVSQTPQIALSDISNESYQRDMAILTPEQRRNRFAW